MLNRVWLKSDAKEKLGVLIYSPTRTTIYSSSTGHSFFSIKEQIKVSFPLLQRYDIVYIAVQRHCLAPDA